MSERAGDRVYTPAWVVQDMLEHFAPSGTILDPCRGRGAFIDLLPVDALWCEVEQGRDFFEWQRPVDWVVGNPPYSMTRVWFRHSYTIAQHLLYLVPLRNVFSGYGFIREIYEFGGIREIRVYGTGGLLGFPMGNAVGAFHIERNYSGSVAMTFYQDFAPQVAQLPLSLELSEDWVAGLVGEPGMYEKSS